MKKLAKLFIISICLLTLILIFVPVYTPSLFESKEAIKNLSNSDLIIIFSPGGWGDAPMERSKDLLPIVEEIKSNLDKWGHNVVVIPYNRAREGILNKFSATKDFFSGYSFSSDKFAADLNALAEQFPDKKIIMTGLSNGAAFINEAYSKMSDRVKDSLYAISIGVPFWSDRVENEKFLQIDNEGKDKLSNGEIGSLIISTIKSPFNWLWSKITGKEMSAFQAEGHTYSWSSPETGGNILRFLEDNVR